SSVFRPSRSRCACPSVRPGISVRPCSSMTLVEGPMWASASSPTKLIRSPETATAEARGGAPMVRTLPFRKTTSAATLLALHPRILHDLRVLRGVLAQDLAEFLGRGGRDVALAVVDALGHGRVGERRVEGAVDAVDHRPRHARGRH